MNKNVKIIIGIVIVIAILAGAIFFATRQKSNLKINNQQDLISLIDKLYVGLEDKMPMLQTMPIDISEKEVLKMYTGTENTDEIEFLVVSEPMMTGQAYSLVLLKVKDGVNANKLAEEIKDKVDVRKWICVQAEKVYTAASGDIVCLVMSNEETAKPVFDKFKEVAGKISSEYERSEKEPDFGDPNEPLPEVQGPVS